MGPEKPRMQLVLAVLAFPIVQLDRLIVQLKDSAKQINNPTARLLEMTLLISLPVNRRAEMAFHDRS